MDVGEGSRLVAGMGVEIPHDDCAGVLGYFVEGIG